MTWRRLGRHRGLLGALLVASAAVAYQDTRPRPGYTWYELPAFDPHAYVAMAHNPSFFTLTPWGYRILTPWIVHQFPPRLRLEGFRRVTLLSLVAAGALLFLFLRRLGHGEWQSLLAVGAFLLSSPVLETVRMPVLGDAVPVMLVVAVLVAVESGADVAVCALLVALGVLAKELAFLLPPLVFLVRRPLEGTRRALAAMLLVYLPGLVLASILRLWWTPHIHHPAPVWGVSSIADTLAVVARDWSELWRRGILDGLLPLALLGAATRAARPYLARYGYLVAATSLLVFGAWIYVPSSEVKPFVLQPRLFIYALPFLLPLALNAVETVWRAKPAKVSGGTPRWLSRAAAVATAALLVAPFLALDPYRRLPLHQLRDGLLIRAFTSESVRTARRLERGEEVIFDLEHHDFAWGASNPAELWKTRWFLRDGWGRHPYYGRGDAVIQGPEATVVLPVLTPREISMRVTLDPAQVCEIDVLANGHAVATFRAESGTATQNLRVPGWTLFRGDNLITLRPRAAAEKTIRLVSLVYDAKG